ncbi:hypothetical protein G6F59_014930 [Rhizopus arrhizus]|nr:hypothetical protein G6F59_014930 [Rhizopus arrhizus]
MERLQGLFIGDAEVARAAGIGQERMLRADARIVQAGRDRMGFDDLAVVVAQHVGAVAMQHARATGGDRRRMAPGADAITCRFGADDLDLSVVEEGMEQADGIAAAADAGGDRIGQAAVLGQHLFACLAPDDGVEIAHHARVRVRTGDGTDDVEGVLHVGHPVAHRFVERILQGGRAGASAARCRWRPCTPRIPGPAVRPPWRWPRHAGRRRSRR